jgi:hypothetical protein
MADFHHGQTSARQTQQFRLRLFQHRARQNRRAGIKIVEMCSSHTINYTTLCNEQLAMNNEQF